MRKASTFRSSPKPFPPCPLQLPPAKPTLPRLLPLLLTLSRNLLKQHDFQIGTFGAKVTTSPTRLSSRSSSPARTLGGGKSSPSSLPRCCRCRRTAPRISRAPPSP